MNPFVIVGNVYERRDGRKAFVYGYDAVSVRYSCVIQGSGEFFSVTEEGKYLESEDSHNDLVKEIK